ncbi:MAG: glutamate--tRNA ligase family protein [Patescibacteria group bacterium]
MSDKIVVRIPPSPTGNLHIGTARTALFNYLFAKKNNGKVLLRSEDTDTERSKKEFEDNILEALEWLGIKHDGELVRQSERGEIYKKYLKTLLDNGSAYISKEESLEEGQPTSPRLRGPRRDEVIRFKNPNKKVVFDDLVRGQVEFDTTDLKDFVIAKSEEEPLYHLAVVVDDAEFGVTHVIRGEDHISNTPRQILIQEALGFQRPLYAHIPLILAPDRSKLSKRHGATAVTDYKQKGYLPEAMVNYLALLGWNPGTDQEIFTMNELIKEFDINKIQKGGAIFDEKKLDWVNKEHIKRLPEDVQKAMKIKEAEALSYIKTRPTISADELVWKDTSREDTLRHLEHIKTLIGSDSAIMEYAEQAGKGSVLWPLRYALSGERASPDPFTLMEVLGKEESLARISSAIEVLK